MAFEHRELPVFGLQFHPESVLTQYGYELLAAFLHRFAGAGHSAPRTDGRRSRPRLVYHKHGGLPMILEGMVTTRNQDGTLNIAQIGAGVDRSTRG